MGNVIDITGQKFGRLTAIECVGRKHGAAQWFCQCECGNTTVVSGRDLRQNKVSSCGCLKKEYLSLNKTKHHLVNTKIYDVWLSMRQRCFNVKNKSYKNYGGRGITICDEWSDFKNFYNWSIANGYVEGLTIDRIDNNGNYEPSNCRWTTRYIQRRNTRTIINITYNGEGHCLKDWAEILGFNYPCLLGRFENGWSVERMFNTPVQKRKTNG